MAEERGHWGKPDEHGLRTWVGKVEWTDRHGDALVHSVLGRPTVVENATLKDGTVVPRIEALSAVDHDVWRRPDDYGGYLLGRITIADDGVGFEHDPDLDARLKANPADDEDELPMTRALARDAHFMARIQDDGFAEAVYASFCNREWRHEDGSRHFISWRRSGRTVANFRRRGESYTDWYPYASSHRHGGLEDREVEDIYARLGWTELTLEQALADQSVAVSVLEGIEARPAGEPRTREMRPLNVDERGDLYARAYRAWEAGRASDGELQYVAERILHDIPGLDVAAVLAARP